MHGGTITSGAARTRGVAGAYWMSWMMSFSNTTAPGVTARLRPTPNTDSSVCEMRPFSTSPIRLRMPRASVSPFESSACLRTSGLVAAKFAGLVMSMNWRAKKRRRCLLRASTSAASTSSATKREPSR